MLLASAPLEVVPPIGAELRQGALGHAGEGSAHGLDAARHISPTKHLSRTQGAGLSVEDDAVNKIILHPSYILQGQDVRTVPVQKNEGEPFTQSRLPPTLDTHEVGRKVNNSALWVDAREIDTNEQQHRKRNTPRNIRGLRCSASAAWATTGTRANAAA